MKIKNLEKDVIFNWDEGESTSGGILNLDSSQESIVVKYQFSDEEDIETHLPPSQEQLELLENFILTISVFKESFTQAVQKHYQTHLTDWVLPEDRPKVEKLLNLPLHELETLFSKPCVGVDIDNNVRFGYYSCPFDEHGAAVLIHDGQIQQVSHAVDLLRF